MPVGSTAYYRSAIQFITGIRVTGLEPGYIVPLITLSITVFLFSAIMLAAPWFGQLFKQKGIVLGGSAAISLIGDAEVSAEQRATFLCAMMAFLGRYVYTIDRLWNRINNNDIYPLSYYYYTARLISAVIVAITLRHSLLMLGLADGKWIVPLGFAAGIKPDFFVVTLFRRVHQIFKIFGSKYNPEPACRPRDMPLFMLDDLSSEKIDRLSCFGIDSAPALGCQKSVSNMAATALRSWLGSGLDCTSAALHAGS